MISSHFPYPSSWSGLTPIGAAKNTGEPCAGRAGAFMAEPMVIGSGATHCLSCGEPWLSGHDYCLICGSIFKSPLVKAA